MEPSGQSQRVIGLTYAAALMDQAPAAGCRYCFLTPPEALPRMGAAWALDLQEAVEAWSASAEVCVDGSAAPGFALKALEGGLKRLSLRPDHPARDDLQAYAEHLGASLRTTTATIEPTWTPPVPQRKRKISAGSQAAD